MSTLSELRRSYHSKIGSQIVRFSERNRLLYPNFADGSSQSSVFIANGIIDCVYHFALDELRQVCEAIPKVKDQSEMLAVMVEGSRLRDISDLPFDIVV